ncbi:hypothetical protein IWW55_005001 [Coemansia sp. RSA 2706]|nr:hypothetical protein LPJ63_001869 [Coemansia sp. RSA 2711]KAJ1845290.1 hypothetical protein LPJ70_002570 [Coemansia sp. RSA 2708]KAJ2296752.1 hypothetical protein IWW55_005001 [Coemansia sp. RSA 2706]KAJ2305416.1 hypothetical protein IWW54_005084 [Coemansia sp. RSA 2705]KAJ2321307.1 hypothetical protein IWW51_004447 [Coemansia sp. RSA 2702]KAJ2364953.1 hypothetical protein H4S01_003511 [Coemansia sp. RSA 2610]KAJ2386506.1 hypothetical protein H4S02_003822 [Coemansia sp. RSA 2611]
MKRRLSLVFKQLKRKIVVGIAGPSSHQRQAVVSLALLALTELALLTLTFCTNFLSAYIHNTAEVFRGFRLRALANAQGIVAFERVAGIFFEQPLQRWHDARVGGWSFWNTYYAGVHPVVTVAFLVFILVRMFAWKLTRVNWKRLNESSDASDYAPLPGYGAPARGSFADLTPAQQYRFLRAVWVLSAWLAFFGFLFVPVMPPRLLPVCDFFNSAGANVGACLTTEYSFIDTIGAHGSLLWDWNDESVKALNNPYAAFPSQHTIFAAWCALCWIHLFGPASPTLPARSARYWLRAVLRWGIVVYPMVTVYCIVVTANHYIADALGGLVVLALSYGAVHLFYALKGRRQATPKELPVSPLPY